MAKVKVVHLRKCWRNGDLEDETVVEDVISFKTQKAAKAYIGSKSTKVYKHKDFYCGYRWTGEKWVNENSGEENEETYQYILEK